MALLRTLEMLKIGERINDQLCGMSVEAIAPARAGFRALRRPRHLRLATRRATALAGLAMALLLAAPVPAATTAPSGGAHARVAILAPVG
jgi:hypothetical protein